MSKHFLWQEIENGSSPQSVVRSSFLDLLGSSRDQVNTSYFFPLPVFLAAALWALALKSWFMPFLSALDWILLAASADIFAFFLVI